MASDGATSEARTPSAAPVPVASSPKKLGELLVAESLITRDQLDAALSFQTQLKTYVPLGQILVNQGVLSRKLLSTFLNRHSKRSRLGEILLKTGAVSRSQLDVAHAQQQQTGLPLGQVLMKLRYISEEALRHALCSHLNIRFFELDRIPLDPSMSRYVNRKYAAHHLIVPLARVGDTLVVAMDDPTNIGLADELGLQIGLDIEIVTSTTASIRRAFAKIYGDDALPSTVEVAGVVDGPGSQAVAETLVRQLLHMAIQSRASDLHLETVPDQMHVRFRIDGVLQPPPLGRLQESLNHNRAEIVSRVKILSKLDIAERRRPQDGSFRMRAERDGATIDVDLRVSIIPGYHGENIVIRILDPHNAPPSVEALGFCDAITTGLLRLLRMPSGMILATGPTGAGKSTTLFGALMSVYRPEIKILTAENPIEYVSELFCQHEVNERTGNTFANYLRSFLRHDPEVIMLGEIRDTETVQLAFRAAQTGHLVLSTLHTNDAVSAVTRLWDLGVDSNLITSSLTGVLSQRLIREVCVDCKQEYAPAPQLLEEVFGAAPQDLTWYRGRGCTACRFTGYRGRIAVGELWTPSDADIVLINKGSRFEELRESAHQSTVFMTEDVLEKLRQGRTNVEELIRTLPYSSLRRLRFAHARPAEPSWPLVEATSPH